MSSSAEIDVEIVWSPRLNPTPCLRYRARSSRHRSTVTSASNLRYESLIAVGRALGTICGRDTTSVTRINSDEATANTSPNLTGCANIIGRRRRRHRHTGCNPPHKRAAFAPFSCTFCIQNRSSHSRPSHFPPLSPAGRKIEKSIRVETARWQRDSSDKILYISLI